MLAVMLRRNVKRRWVMITEEEVEKAIDYLRDTAVEAAQARADRIYLEEYRKSLKAIIMSEFAGLAIGAQERQAYRDQRYVDLWKR